MTVLVAELLEAHFVKCIKLAGYTKSDILSGQVRAIWSTRSHCTGCRGVGVQYKNTGFSLFGGFAVSVEVCSCVVVQFIRADK